MLSKHPSKASRATKAEKPGIGLEQLVARIQQLMDPNSTVTHNEVLEDRVGNKRQYDIVIRGKFGGRPVLGVMECKDHSRKKGPDAVEAFAKKTENLGANLRVMVSKKGFTKQALRLAKHENIGCVSPLPKETEQVGFSIGDFWYGIFRMWTRARLLVHFADTSTSTQGFDSDAVKWDGKPVINWFLKELLTTYGEDVTTGEYSLHLEFKTKRKLEINGKQYEVNGLTCEATRVNQNKRKWVSWSGDAFYDWHTSQLTIPAKTQIVGSFVETDLSKWDDFERTIPKLQENDTGTFFRLIIQNLQPWDSSKDNEVPDLSDL